jgi:hypothetical protein
MLLDPRECDVLQDSIGQSERAKRIHRRHPRVGIDGDGLIRWLRSLSGNEARIASEHTRRRVSLPGIHPDSPDGARPVLWRLLAAVRGWLRKIGRAVVRTWVSRDKSNGSSNGRHPSARDQNLIANS